MSGLLEQKCEGFLQRPLPAACFFSSLWSRWVERWGWRWRSQPKPTARDAKRKKDCCQGLFSWNAVVLRKHYISTYLPEEEETESNLDGSQPDSVEVNHKVHELLSVCWNQIHNLAHSASPPGCAVYHQRLDWQQRRERHFSPQCSVSTVNLHPCKTFRQSFILVKAVHHLCVLFSCLEGGTLLFLLLKA